MKHFFNKGNLIKKYKKYFTAVVVAINLVLVTVVILQFYTTASENSVNIEKRNLSNIENINSSSAELLSNFIKNQYMRMSDVSAGIAHYDMDYDKAMDYLYALSDEDSTNMYFELIDSTTKQGGIAKKREGDDEDYVKINYSNSSYSSLHKVIEDNSEGISFTPEFTDNYDRNSSFALHVHITLDVVGSDLIPVPTEFTLMEVFKTADFIDLLGINGGYDNLASVIIDKSGNYILKNSAFLTTNFFDYIKNYNNLSLDDAKAIKEKLINEKKGQIFYLNAQNDECVYSYILIPDTEWYCVTCVPKSAFQNVDDGMTNLVTVVVLLLAMLILDVIWLFTLNRNLKLSADSEKAANESKTYFLSRMSHDIRTPLNGIIGMNLLAMGEENSPKTQNYLNNIDSSSKFLLGLVNDILDMNKVESGKMELYIEPYTFEEFTSYIDAIIVPLAKEKKISFTLESEIKDLAFYVDKLRFNQIFFNLLSNAVKFTAEGGAVKLIVNQITTPNGGDALEGMVIDNGIGMSEEFQEHMFEVFSQEKSSNTEIRGREPGSGLGLAIVNNLVKLMNGAVSVKSKRYEGTTFTVTIPTKIAETPKAIAETEKKADFQGKHVLLCEDNAINREIAEAFLQNSGFIVDVAENGKEGVEMLENSEDGFYSLVLMDVRMPIMDGITATKYIRQIDREYTRSIPIIAMTADAYASDINKCIMSGMNDHIAKPIEPKSMLAKIAKYI